MRIDPSAFVAPTAILLGDVAVGASSSIWYGAVIRADTAAVTIGEATNIQDGAIIHVDPGYPCAIGDRVTVGHRAVIHGAQIGNEVLVGIGAIILTGATIGDGCLVAAGALIEEGVVIPPGHWALGLPARVRGPVSPAQRDRILRSAQDYVRYAAARGGA